MLLGKAKLQSQGLFLLPENLFIGFKSFNFPVIILIDNFNCNFKGLLLRNNLTILIKGYNNLILSLYARFHNARLY